jgi:hypothetical protein
MVIIKKEGPWLWRGSGACDNGYELEGVARDRKIRRLYQNKHPKALTHWSMGGQIIEGGGEEMRRRTDASVRRYTLRPALPTPPVPMDPLDYPVNAQCWGPCPLLIAGSR